MQTASSCSSCRQRADPNRRAGGWTRGRTHDHDTGRAEVRCGRRGGSGIGGLHPRLSRRRARRVTQLQRRIVASLHDRGRMRMRRERVQTKCWFWYAYWFRVLEKPAERPSPLRKATAGRQATVGAEAVCGSCTLLCLGKTIATLTELIMDSTIYSDNI